MTMYKVIKHTFHPETQKSSQVTTRKLSGKEKAEALASKLNGKEDKKDLGDNTPIISYSVGTC